MSLFLDIAVRHHFLQLHAIPHASHIHHKIGNTINCAICITYLSTHLLAREYAVDDECGGRVIEYGGLDSPARAQPINIKRGLLGTTPNYYRLSNSAKDLHFCCTKSAPYFIVTAQHSAITKHPLPRPPPRTQPRMPPYTPARTPHWPPRNR